MTDDIRTVIGGVDTHADTHEAAALDERGRLLGLGRFTATIEGHQQLLSWMRGFGQIQQVGVEGTGSYGARLTRHLQAAGITVVEVNRPHAHTRARRGESDAMLSSAPSTGSNATAPWPPATTNSRFATRPRWPSQRSTSGYDIQNTA